MSKQKGPHVGLSREPSLTTEPFSSQIISQNTQWDQKRRMKTFREGVSNTFQISDNRVSRHFSGWRRCREEIVAQVEEMVRAKAEQQSGELPEGRIPIILIFIDVKYLSGDWKYVVCSGNQ